MQQTEGMTSSTSISVVILGTKCAGGMKGGVFTVMSYLMPLMPNRDLPPAKRAMPLHASANICPDDDVSIFLGLSGTRKTTLSADPKCDLNGDDEHVWHTKGVFNIEGGCYAKTIGLIVESGLCKRALVQWSYAIGVPKPLSLRVVIYGTDKATSLQMILPSLLPPAGSSSAAHRVTLSSQVGRHYVHCDCLVLVAW